jgi:hypothetical protein
MLPVSLDCPFVIAPLVFSDVYLSWIPKGQSQMDNPEKLATYGTQDTGQINVREYQRGNHKWTIQRNWQNRVHMTSGLCIFDCPFGTHWRLFVLCLVCPMLPVSLDGIFVISPLVFSHVYFSCVMCTLFCQFLWIVHLWLPLWYSLNKRQRIPKGQSKLDNPEKLAT